MKSALISLASLVLLACSTGSETDGAGGGGGGGAIDRFAAGDRLTPRAWRDGHGADDFVGFFDTELGVACTFQLTVDGELRCLPEDVGVFADDACSVPAIADYGCGAVTFASRADVTSGPQCGRGYPVVEVFESSGEPIEGEVHTLNLSRCEGGGGPESSLTAAERVPLDRFVRGVEEDFAVGGGLGGRRIRGDDGSFVVTRLLRDGHVCGPATVDGSVRCVDLAVGALELAQGQLYADATCSGDRAAYDDLRSSPGGPAITCRAEEPALAVDWSDDACSPEATVYATGEVLPDAFLTTEACGSQAYRGQTFRRVGDVVPAKDLPPLAAGEAGTGRLRLQLVGGASAPLVPGDLRSNDDELPYLDTELGTLCKPMAAADGTTRCVPPPINEYTKYTDATCDTVLIVTDAAGDCAPAEEPRFHTTASYTTCATTVVEVRGRGEPFSGMAYNIDEFTGECGPDQAREGFAVGAAIPLSDFAELTLE